MDGVIAIFGGLMEKPMVFLIGFCVGFLVGFSVVTLGHV